MMGYDYQIVYKKGSSNVVADTLSKRPSGGGTGELQAITTLYAELFVRIQLE